jgi:ribosome-associated protein
MNETTDTISIDESELQMDYMRATGPGGQNVNKVATAVQLRFDVLHSKSLPEEVKARLVKLAGKRVTQEGVLVIEAKRFRTQEKNREDALARLSGLVQKALEKPTVRKRTKPTKAAQQVRLKEKKHRGEIKRSRARSSVEQE